MHIRDCANKNGAANMKFEKENWYETAPRQFNTTIEMYVQHFRYLVVLSVLQVGTLRVFMKA